MKKVLEALFGSWPPPRWLIVLTVLGGILAVLFIFIPEVIAVLFGAAVFLYIYYKNWSARQKAANEAALAMRASQLLYTARFLLFRFFNDNRVALRFAILHLSFLDQIEFDYAYAIGSCRVYRAVHHRPLGAPPLEQEDVALLTEMMRKSFVRELNSEPFVVPPICYGRIPVIYPVEVCVNDCLVTVDIGIVPDAKAAADLENALWPPAAQEAAGVDVGD